MNTENILNTAKNLGSYVTVLILLTAIAYAFLKDEINLTIEKLNSVNSLQAELEKEKLKNELNANEIAFFNSMLKDYLENHSQVDLSKKTNCDSEFQQSYNQAEATLNALEGLAKSLGKYDAYENFFKNEKGSMRIITGCP